MLESVVSILTDRLYTVVFCHKSGYNLNITAFWDIVPCSPLEVDRHFGDAYCLHYQGDDESSTHL
jgi:hypothetical protein